MPNTSLFYRDKFKFLTDSYTNIQNYARNIREYVDRAIPDRFKSAANIFNLTIDVTQDVSTLHLLWAEDQENELNVFTAQHEGNLRGIAQMSGHQPALPISASGTVKLSINKTGLADFGSRVILSENAKFRCKENGLEYSMKREQPIRIQTNSTFLMIELIEGSRKTQTFVADTNTATTGDNLYTIYLDDVGSIENSYLKTYVNNKLWKEYDSLRDMSSTTEGYLKRVGYGSQLDLVFGNNISGKRIKSGDSIRTEYLLTHGERGNVGIEAEFEILSGLFDIQGNEINASEYFSIIRESGFELGSNGESAEVTRAMTGWASRSNTFARPDYIVEFLSKYSIISYASAWTLANDLVFNILALPKLNLATSREYLTISDDKLALSASQEASIKQALENSKRQWVSTSFVFVKPALRKYALFIFVEGNIYDANDLKIRIENVVSDIMLSKTYGDVDKDISNNLISNSDFVNAVYDLTEVEAVSVDVVSETNESALINGFYNLEEEVREGGAITKVTRRVNVNNDNNPHLGLSELGDVATKDHEIPVLRGGFKIYQEDGDHVILPQNPINIMIKRNNEWVSI